MKHNEHERYETYIANHHPRGPVLCRCGPELGQPDDHQGLHLRRNGENLRRRPHHQHQPERNHRCRGGEYGISRGRGRLSAHHRRHRLARDEEWQQQRGPEPYAQRRLRRRDHSYECGGERLLVHHAYGRRERDRQRHLRRETDGADQLYRPHKVRRPAGVQCHRLYPRWHGAGDRR